jgi:glycopeptide antibiotics resistance protein
VKFLIAIMAALIVYGSLFPFAFVPHTPSIDDVRALFAFPAEVSRGDIVGNILLFIPFGSVLVAVARLPTQVFLSLAAASLFALAIQYVQFWFPSRVPSSLDALCNIAGLLVGWVLFGVWQIIFRAHSQVGSRQRSEDLRFRQVALAIALLWVVYRWFPLVPTLDFQNVKNSLKPLILDRTWSLPSVVHDTIAWLAWFRLIRYVVGRRESRLYIYCLGAFILCCEPFFLGNTVSLGNVIGLLIGILIHRIMPPGKVGLFMSALTLLFGLVYIGVIDSLPPHIEREMSCLPFSGFLTGSLTVNTASLIEKLFLFSATALFLNRLDLPATLSTLAFGGLVFFIEFVQKWSLSRSSEITDPLLVVFIGVSIAKLLSEKLTPIDRIAQKYQKKHRDRNLAR